MHNEQQRRIPARAAKRIVLAAIAALALAGTVLAAAPAEEAHAMRCFRMGGGGYVCTAP